MAAVVHMYISTVALVIQKERVVQLARPVPVKVEIMDRMAKIQQSPNLMTAQHSIPAAVALVAGVADAVAAGSAVAAGVAAAAAVPLPVAADAAVVAGHPGAGNILLFIQTAGSLAALSPPGHILMYVTRWSELAACLHPE